MPGDDARLSRPLRHDGNHARLQLPAGYMNLSGGIDEDIDLAPHAELRQINTRLDGKAGARQDESLLVRFQVIHVGAVAMDFLLLR